MSSKRRLKRSQPKVGRIMQYKGQRALFLTKEDIANEIQNIIENDPDLQEAYSAYQAERDHAMGELYQSMAELERDWADFQNMLE